MIHDLARAPFDLATGPLVRTALIRLSPESHVLAVVIHHIVADGWSFRDPVRGAVGGLRGDQPWR